MVTYVKGVPAVNGNSTLIEIACNSGDTKPVDGVLTGSVCIEVDTGDLYMFDEETTSWVKQ